MAQNVEALQRWPRHVKIHKNSYEKLIKNTELYIFSSQNRVSFSYSAVCLLSSEQAAAAAFQSLSSIFFTFIHSIRAPHFYIYTFCQIQKKILFFIYFSCPKKTKPNIMKDSIHNMSTFRKCISFNFFFFSSLSFGDGNKCKKCLHEIKMIKVTI